MSEVLGEINIYAATAIGYIAGQGLDLLALRHIAQNREAAIPGHENIQANKDRSNLIRRSVASLALLGAAAGFCFAESANTSTTTELKPATLVVVADRSFGTSLDGSSNSIMESVKLVNETPRVNITDIAAQYSSSKVETPKEMEKSPPYGQPSTDQAVSSAFNIALSHSSKVVSNQLGQKAEENAGILVLTDGNTIGSPASIKAEDTTNLPIDIVNYGINNNANAAQLKKIAIETNGQYLSVKSSPNVAIKKLDKAIEPRSTKRTIPGNRWPWIGMGLALSTITGKQYFRRRKETAL